MGKIPMRSGFTLIPEGEYVFRIYDVEYDEDFGKLVIKLVNAKGETHSERFSLKNQDDSYNDKALNAFAYFAKTALNDFSLADGDEIDPEELIGHYIRAEVKHTQSPSSKDPNKMNTYANLGDKSPADAFDITPVERALSIGRKETKKVDLDSLLD